MKRKMEDHEKRKKARVEMLHITQHQTIIEDPQYQKEIAQIDNRKVDKEAVKKVLQDDKTQQKESL